MASQDVVGEVKSRSGWVIFMGVLTAALALTMAACGERTERGGVKETVGERAAAAVVPDSVEIALGRENAEEVARTVGLYADTTLGAYVQRLGVDMARLTERPDLPWTFKVVDDPSVNAFALPGGFIFITRGMLTAVTSEAELATVLGHEIGHVTARHAARQLGKKMAANAVLTLALLNSPRLLLLDLATGAGGAGVQLLSWKWSRTDEEEADARGFAYTLDMGFDPRVQSDLFATLDRVEKQKGGGTLPTWASTHPSTSSRYEDARKRGEKMQSDTRPLRLGRDEYLARIDGLVYGVDTRAGFLRGSTFYDPERKFQVSLPPDWSPQASHHAATATSPDERAVFMVGSSTTADPKTAAQQFVDQDGVLSSSTPQTATVSGLPAVTITFKMEVDEGLAQGTGTFLAYRGNGYALVGLASPGKFDHSAPAFSAATASFAPLTDARLLSVQPLRVQIVRLTRSMTMAQFAAAYPSGIPAEEVATINGVEMNAVLTTGTLLKRVTSASSAQSIVDAGDPH